MKAAVHVVALLLCASGMGCGSAPAQDSPASTNVATSDEQEPTNVSSIAAADPVALEETTSDPPPATPAPELEPADETRDVYLEDNQREPLRSARWIPHQESGQTTAVTTYGIRRNSFMGQIGFRNGDRVVSVNGVSAVDDFENMIQELTTATSIRAEVVRRGQAHSFETRFSDTPLPEQEQAGSASPPADTDENSVLESEAGAPPTAPNSAISRTSSTSWSIPEDALSEALSNPTSSLQSVRAVPRQVDGQTVGVRVYGIRRLSLARQIGFNNGDTIMTVNGHSVASPHEALEAYAELRTVREIRVVLERRGQERVHVYQVVPTAP